MEIGNYLTELERAQKSQDPNSVINAMQKFFTAIATISILDKNFSAKVIGLYMTAKQLEKNGLDTSVVKTAIYARVSSGNRLYSFSWEEVVHSLNPLFEMDGFKKL